MKEKEILYNLCAYNPMNPDYIEGTERDETKPQCFCDNCFYGRTELAEEILRLRKIKNDESKIN